MAQQVMHQQANGSASRTLGRAAFPRSAGDVQVSPWKLSHKTLQKLGRRDGTACSPRHIAHVGKIAFQRQQRSCAASPAEDKAAASTSLFAKSPLRTAPKAITQAPVKVAMSTTAAGLKRAA